ncbi:MAG TPA: helix-turn-helix transcriptional regulator [Gallionella sp.]|nr:helix-turn-helix transcriptional regulator [Gallionella sp.]
MDTPADSTEFIHRLWDELADFDAARSDEALDHLLSALCHLVDAQNANWIGAVRMGNILPGDPVGGWRPRYIDYLHPLRQVVEKTEEQVRMLEAGVIDITTVKNVSFAGRFRCNLLADLVPPEWFDSDYYHTFYLNSGHADAIWAGCPVNEDAEVYFGIFRDAAHSRFSVADRDAVAYALRGIKWFHRQLMLSHGVLVAATMLTPAERTVLHLLLTGLAEKQIAVELGRSYHTTHEYVSSIYRKYGVNNRASLMALWLGQSA